ncbi:hypothetical protein BU25DRAFT_269409 [Macroventuria anomochaeta]|uniref:Uncharacterized protein n=1 Tax=Macroventuria anomochaeta TaxID=301207 RepID=A0ACB6S7T4_9PLEO|nr:uncharacterized protein BU25DRAFT_269409 [Macroventuria anomochaeta]KAF2629577.1 hypothetical protein BU25DRAFT_269409 [Macroventuria anomochaeta]
MRIRCIGAPGQSRICEGCWPQFSRPTRPKTDNVGLGLWARSPGTTSETPDPRILQGPRAQVMPAHLDKEVSDCDAAKMFLSDRTSPWSACSRPSSCLKNCTASSAVISCRRLSELCLRPSATGRTPYQDETLAEIPRLLNNAMTANDDGDRFQFSHRS